MVYLLVKYLHVIGATVLLGTGGGIAFFMLIAHLSGRPATIAAVARIVVLADFVFTATAVIAQPVTGVWLAQMTGFPLTSAGFPLTSGWLLLSIILYVATGLFWLPVVWIQMRLRDLAQQAVAASSPLPPAYHRLFRIWFLLGWPAFAAVLAILWLMLAKPELPWLSAGT